SGDAATGKRAIANVGGTPITKAQVSHWMASVAGLDYYTASRRAAAPEGLVSDPPNYERCVKQIEAAMNSSRGRVVESSEELQARCRQLYRALRTQAMTH